MKWKEIAPPTPKFGKKKQNLQVRESVGAHPQVCRKLNVVKVTDN